MKAKEEREATWRAATTGREVVRRGQEKNQKQKILIIYLYYNFFGKHTIGYFPWA